MMLIIYLAWNIYHVYPVIAHMSICLNMNCFTTRNYAISQGFLPKAIYLKEILTFPTVKSLANISLGFPRVGPEKQRRQTFPFVFPWIGP